jgi:hypothetical protein
VVAIKLFVEGGGDSKTLRTACREGFAEFLGKAGLKGSMPRIVACGGRGSAYNDFCTAVANGQPALLLVDSEAPVAAQHQPGDDKAQWMPWAHLAQRQGDGWTKPIGADDKDCHLMVQCMESWLLADRQTLQAYFGQGFKPNALPAASRPIEGIDKDTLYQALKAATANCKTKAEYGKGEHSFKLLARIDPQKVTAASGWAERFVAEAESRMGA